MIIDKKGKLFGKISIVDLIIIIVVLIGLVGIFYKFQRSATVTPFSSLDKIQLTLQTDDVDAFTVDAIEIGDVVKDYQSNIVLGKVTDIRVGDAIIEKFNSDGQVVLSSRPDHVSIEIDVVGDGIYSAHGASSFGSKSYFINRSAEIAVGDVIYWIRISKVQLAE